MSGQNLGNFQLGSVHILRNHRGEGGRWTEMITFDYDIFGGGGVLFLGDYVSKFSEILNEDLT